MRVQAMAALGLGMTAVVASQAWTEEPKPPGPVEVAATVEKVQYGLMEPIRVTVTARNISNRPVGISGSIGYQPYVNYRAFRITVFDQQGCPVRTTHFLEVDAKYGGLPVGMSSGSAGTPFAFNPGETYRGQLIANLAYDMTSPGEYTIVVEFPLLGQGIGEAAHSEPIRVKVREPKLSIHPEH